MNKDKIFKKITQKTLNIYSKYNELEYIAKPMEQGLAVIGRIEKSNIKVSDLLDDYNSLKLRPYFIPKDFYNKRLSRKNLIDNEWKSIRDYLRNRYNGCFFCKNKTKKMHCHEDWYFNYKNNSNIIQLRSIFYICDDCNNVIHFNHIFNNIRDAYMDIKSNIDNISNQEFKSKVKDLKQEIKKTDKKIKNAINKFNEVNNTNNISLKNTILVASKNCWSLYNYNDEQRFKYDKESFIKSINRIDEKTCKSIMNNEKVKEEFNF